jgi:type I restriction enzyme S subunit
MILKRKKIGEIINLKRGYDLPSMERVEGDVPIISSSGITDFHNEFKKVGKGVVTGRYGTLGEVFYINGKYWPLNTTLYVTDFKGNDPKFIYYFLKTLKLERFNGAAAVPGLDRNVIHRVEVLFPEHISIQTKIASILSAYDELIENNKQRIKMLEEMAEEIYKEWFVRFRFPGYEFTKFFDVKGKEVPHGTLGALPEGWDKTKVENVYKTSSGGTPSRLKEAEYFNGEIDWVKTGELKDSFILDTEEHITEIGLKNSSAKLFPENTLLMAMYGVNIGQLGISSKPAAANQAVCVFNPIDGIETSLVHSFYFFKSIRSHLFNISMGAAQQNLSQDLIKKIDFLKPNAKIIRNYHSIVFPFFEEIKILSQKSQLLQQTRDLLLPRLISGKLSVAHLIEQESESLAMAAEPIASYGKN